MTWLKERAVRVGLDDISIDHLDRFIKAIDHPPVTKRFRAAAVICQSLLDGELAAAPDTTSPDYALVVLAIPDLKKAYTAVFEAATTALPRPPSSPPSFAVEEDE